MHEPLVIRFRASVPDLAKPRRRLRLIAGYLRFSVHAQIRNCIRYVYKAIHRQAARYQEVLADGHQRIKEARRFMTCKQIPPNPDCQYLGRYWGTPKSQARTNTC